MKKGTKIVIGVVMAVLLTIVLSVGGLVGGFLYLTDRAYMENARKEEQAKIDGREFGKTTDQNGCMEKGFSFEPEERFFVNVGFVEECLESSQPIPNFCDDVPPENDKYGVREKWREDQCEKTHKFPDHDQCFRTMVAKESYCNSQRRGKPAESDGIEFGKTTDQNGCMEKGFTLPNDFSSKQSFTRGCLRSSRPTPDFCKGVPIPDLKRTDQKWADEQCKIVGHNRDSCFSAFYAKRDFCMYEGDKKK